jgi:predicted metal-dependent HD superfamily phosphohydrolase
MTQPEIEIRRAWRQIAGHHHDGHVDALLVRYREPHRRYHTATHIMWVLRHLHDMSPTLFPSSSALPAELLAAALYHDAIYDPPAGDNEARSAALAMADLAEVGWAPERCVPVQALILATAGHLTEGEATPIDDDVSAETAMLLDADLAILGAEPGAYQAYVNGVRAEYAHVDDDEWRTGRAGVLQHFLDRPRLFVTDFMHNALEHRAGANIEAELAALRRSAASD